MKRALFISYDGMTDVLGQSQVLPYLLGLRKRGYEISILSFEKKDRYRNEGQLIRNMVAAAGIAWIPLTYSGRIPLFSKVYDLWQMRRTALKTFGARPFDLIHCRSYVAAGAGLMLKRKFGAKFLFDMRGFWVDERVDNGQWNLRHPLYRWLYRRYKEKERDFLLNADGIISLTDAAGDVLKQSPGYSGLPITVIPCCADLAHFDYRSISKEVTEKRKADLGIGEQRKVIAYLGSTVGWYLMAEMFDFFVCLQERHPEYLLLLITRDDATSLHKEAALRGIRDLVVVGSDRAGLPSLLSICDCSFFFIRPTFSKIASSPTKHAELMGMGIPVICNDIGDTGRVIDGTGSGLVVGEFSTKEYRSVVEKIPALCKIEKSFIREGALKYFDLSVGVERYASVYRDLLKENAVG
jgi:glycosyltransferase involved in cell wall biosynthesis